VAVGECGVWIFDLSMKRRMWLSDRATFGTGKDFCGLRYPLWVTIAIVTQHCDVVIGIETHPIEGLP
jgi:hypothetical protein